MNWITYKKLTSEQREEWKFKFAEKNYPALSLNSVVFLWMIMAISMCITLIILKEYVSVQTEAVAYLVYGAIATKWLIVISVAEHLVYGLAYLWNVIQEKRWIKNAIKTN